MDYKFIEIHIQCFGNLLETNEVPLETLRFVLWQNVSGLEFKLDSECLSAPIEILARIVWRVAYIFTGIPLAF